jgi:hypothetical protein
MLYQEVSRPYARATTPCVATTRHPAAGALCQPRRAMRLLTSGLSGSTTRRPDCTSSTAPMPCIQTRRLDARLLVSQRTGYRRVPGHSVVRGDYPSCGRNRSTSPTTSVRVPRHVALWLITPIVIDYFDYAARPIASARRAARHIAHRATRRRLLHLCRATGCLGMSRGLSRGSSSTTPPHATSSTTSPTPCDRVPRHVALLVSWLVVDYFAYVARPGASAHCAASLAALRRLLRLRCASGCLGSSRGSSSTTSTMPRDWVLRHVAWLVTRHVARLVFDFFAYTACPGTSACCAAHRQLLRLAQARR